MSTSAQHCIPGTLNRPRHLLRIISNSNLEDVRHCPKFSVGINSFNSHNNSTRHCWHSILKMRAVREFPGGLVLRF